MSLIAEIDIGIYARHVNAKTRDLVRQFNKMAGSISTAYQIELRSLGFSFDPFKKLSVSLHISLDDDPHTQNHSFQDAVDIYFYHQVYDLHSLEAFGCMTYVEKCNEILETLHHGLLKIADNLKIDSKDFTTSYEKVKSYNFIFKYRKGKPSSRKKVGLSATLGMVETPKDISVVAYLVRIADAEEIGTLTFIHTENPGISFAKDYLGQIKWLSDNRIVLIPKNRQLVPIEVDLKLKCT